MEGGNKKNARVERRRVGRPKKYVEPVGIFTGTPAILTCWCAKCGLLILLSNRIKS